MYLILVIIIYGIVISFEILVCLSFIYIMICVIGGFVFGFLDVGVKSGVRIGRKLVFRVRSLRIFFSFRFGICGIGIMLVGCLSSLFNVTIYRINFND